MHDMDILKIIDISINNDVDTAMDELRKFFDEKDSIAMQMLVPPNKKWEDD